MTMEGDIANAALDLAMEWGPDWLKPVQGRLTTLYPHLSVAELDAYNELARKTMFAGFNLVESMLGPNGNIDLAAWQDGVLQEAPWVNSGNLMRMFSQGMYYAMK